MYMKRKIDQFLLNWKNKDKKPVLIIKGARQIGKTYSILEFGKNNYQNVVYINFFEMPEYLDIFKKSSNPNDILNQIILRNPSIKIDKNSLIFFDEIQNNIEILTALKFFSQHINIDIVCSGSMLGINTNQITSIPVGFIEEVEMFSMDFEEFLWAIGYDESKLNFFKSFLFEFKKIDDLTFKLMSDLFNTFTILGGMPRIIHEYVKTNSFLETYKLQKNLKDNYLTDIRQYSNNIERIKISSLFEHIPLFLASENKKVFFKNIINVKTIEKGIPFVSWLNSAGITASCYNLKALDIPLKLNYDQSTFKMYFKDTSILIASLEIDDAIDLRANQNIGIIKGGFAENLVAEALIKQGIPLYYFKKADSTLELDFLIRYQNNIIPIEVKATNGNSKSLKEVLTNPKYDKVNFAIKLARSNIGYSNGIFTIPIFYSFLLKEFIDKFEFNLYIKKLNKNH